MIANNRYPCMGYCNKVVFVLVMMVIIVSQI